MNIRKNIDYSGLYAEIDKAFVAGLSQMELYLELGRLVGGRPEKGAAVMAAEYITANYPERAGFSPRSLRRMREFYRMYEGHPEVLKQAMKVGWTQNIVILEADLDMDARLWYLQAVQRFGWSKAELIEQIIRNAHLEVVDGDGTSNGIQKPISKIEVQTVDFLEELWYNWFRQICFSRQMGTKGEVYG
mgnify:CR=1 FL=1